VPVPTIFLIDNNNQIVEMKDHPYDSEELLQKLLARWPSVLAGDQMNGDAPVKWLLVSREVGRRTDVIDSSRELAACVSVGGA
jgi:hypothetical protein